MLEVTPMSPLIRIQLLVPFTAERRTRRACADPAHVSEIERDPNDVLLGIMHRSEAEAMAIDASGIGL